MTSETWQGLERGGDMHNMAAAVMVMMTISMTASHRADLS